MDCLTVNDANPTSSQDGGNAQAASVVRGAALKSEPGLGSLTIPGYLREVTERHPQREAAVVLRDGAIERWSYQDLWQRSQEVARALIAAGVTKDTRVGILMSNRLEYLSLLFGTAMAGGVSVALSTFSTPPELGHLLQVSAVSILFVEPRVANRDFVATLCDLEPALASGSPPLVSATFPFLERVIALDAGASCPAGVERWAAFIAGGAAIPGKVVASRAAAVAPSDTGVLFFSSGTTSLPKGILHSQRALAVQWWRWPRIMDIDAERHPVRCWTGNGLFWSGNMSMMIGNALSTGGTMVLQPTFQAEEALHLMESERVSFPMGRPHQWVRLQECARWAEADLSSLHYVTYADRIMEHPTVQTDWRLGLAFGTTETLTINTCVVSNTAEEDARGSYGSPLPGNILKIFDPATGAVVPRGQRGEIAIKGPTLMMGYVGKVPEDTFDEDGFFCTGDGGYVDEDGRLFWEGRLTDIIKTGGANVSPVEVDLALALLPGVKRAQTVGVPHDTLGEIVVSCIVPDDHSVLGEDQVRTFLKDRLASYKLPRAVLFFAEDELAVTGSEKIKTAALRELAQSRLAAVPAHP